MSGRVDLSDFVAGFLLEAEEHLHSINHNLVSTSEGLKKGLPEPRAVRDLFRSLHTIKGLAAMVGAEPIVDISHEMEGLLRTADRAGGKVSEQVLDLLVQGTRAVEERVRILGQQGISKIPAAPAKLIEALALAQAPDVKEKPRASAELLLPTEISKSLSPADREHLSQATQSFNRVLLIEFQPSPEKAASGLNITSIRENLAKIGELVKVAPRSLPTAPTGIAFSILLATNAEDSEINSLSGNSQIEIIARPVAEKIEVVPTEMPSSLEEDSAPEWLPGEQSSIRVDVRRLDEALEQLSGLFVTRFKLERVANEMNKLNIDTRELKSVIAENARQLRRLRTAISSARMVPLDELLQRIPLIVRGITKDSDKTVNISILAGSAEVDKAVADKIFPAIVHLIRNAVDHAIESREERKKLSKSEAGQLTIICDDSSGTSLTLTITDDGRGINREAVAKKANRAPARDDEELLEQICIAGLSTSQAITHTSGRGMGMDIVKRSIEMLGGTLSLKTTPGKGTVIAIQVPVTITIVDVFSFVSGEQTFVTPVSIVDEIIEVASDSSVPLPSSGVVGTQARLIQHRGKAIPLFILDSLLQGQDQNKIPSKAFILNRGQGSIAFGIDRVIGKQEAVVRPLDDSLIRVTGMAGATDLGDGRPTLVVDLAALGQSVTQQSKNLEVSL